MSDFDIDILSEDLNVFDRKRPIAVIRSKRHSDDAGSEDFLAHFGTKGMKWGVRRYQDEDGNLTELGRQRYGVEGKRSALGRTLDVNKLDRERGRAQSYADYYKARANDRQSRKEYRATKRGETYTPDEKVKKWNTKSAEFQELANRSKEMADKIIQSSLDKKMSVLSKTVLRKGKRDYADGSHFKIKNNGKGIQAHKARDVQRLKANAYRRKAHRAYSRGYITGYSNRTDAYRARKVASLLLK